MMLLLTRLALLMVVLVLPACEESGVCIDVRVDPELPASVQHDLEGSCPICPLTARATYRSQGDYVRCVVRTVRQARRRGELTGREAGRLLARSLRMRVAGRRPARTLPPGPGENGYDPGLAELASQYDRQFLSFHAAPFSMSLDVHVDEDAVASREAIASFLADPNAGQGPEAFRAFSGRDVFDVVDHYGEIGDLGMFGGVAAAGDAFRYAVLRDACAQTGRDCPSADAARQHLLGVLETLHVAHAITGERGVVVRGLFRRGMPRRGGDPETVPLLDAQGDPNPACSQKPENPTFASFSQRLRFREDATQTTPGNPSTGEFPEWLWMDNASKDQLIGWVYATGALYDVVRDDPAIPASFKRRLAEDAARMARRLMRPAGPLGLDLTILDADGCVTTFHDLHPDELEGVSVSGFVIPLIVSGGLGEPFPPGLLEDLQATRNAFNALLALATMRTFCHVSGARDVCSFYYDELVDARGWPALLLQTPIPLRELPAGSQERVFGLLGFPEDLTTLGSLGIDFNHETNYSNVNMAFVGFYGLLRYEAEPELRALYADALERSLWDTGIDPRQPRVLGQSFFDFIYAGLRAEGTDTAAVLRGATTLSEFDLPPYLNVPRENCDENEISRGACLAEDGTPIELAPSLGRSGALVAIDALPKRIRPPSNFEWRSNPYAVNGGGGDRINPGGDFRGAYWLGRFLRRGEGGAVNLASGTRGR
jgi:hypothetical protein